MPASLSRIRTVTRRPLAACCCAQRRRVRLHSVGFADPELIERKNDVRFLVVESETIYRHEIVTGDALVTDLSKFREVGAFAS